MSDQDSSRQDTTFLGPSGTQRMSGEKRKLPDPTPALADVITKAYLIRDHSNQGEAQRIALEQARTVVGREESDIVLDDSTVSSQHFAVERDDSGDFSIHDLGSSNGTALNGTEIRSAPLSSGDRIQAGKSGFVFRTIQTIPWDQSGESRD
jgi:pSer/pThr/pTyr-binding forkhead associated (FHA) protein